LHYTYWKQEVINVKFVNCDISINIHNCRLWLELATIRYGCYHNHAILTLSVLSDFVYFYTLGKQITLDVSWCNPSITHQIVLHNVPYLYFTCWVIIKICYNFYVDRRRIMFRVKEPKLSKKSTKVINFRIVCIWMRIRHW